MQWSMPRPVLQVVAGVIAATAIGSFTLGALTASPRGRLPGERDNKAGAVVLEATDATPLAAERIEGTPPPVELTEEEKAKLEAEKKAREEAAAAAELAKLEDAARITPPPAAAPPPPPAAPADSVGDILDKVTPKADEPVF